MQNEKSMYEHMADFQANYRSPQSGVPGHKIVGVVLMFARLILNHFGAQEMTLKRRDDGTGVDVYIDGEKALNGKIWQVNTDKVGHA